MVTASFINALGVTFLFSAYFGDHFCYHSNGKSQTKTRLLHIYTFSTNKKKMVKSNFLMPVHVAISALLHVGF